MTKKSIKKRDKKENSWIDRTIFWSALSPQFFETFQKQVEHYKKTKSSSDDFLSEKDKRIRKIYEQFKALTSHLDDIQKTVTYFKLIGLTTFLKRNNIPQPEYFRFMYENHQIRVTSTLDICTKLGDLVYRTGIKEKYCNWYKFINHEKVKTKPCAKVLADFADRLYFLRLERNQIIHHGGYINETVNSINTYSFDKKDLNNSSILVPYFRSEKKKELRKLEKEMKMNYNSCFDYVRQFINSLADDIDKMKHE